MPQLEPVDHDPFANPKLAFMPVDHNPFEDIVAGSQPLMSLKNARFDPSKSSSRDIMAGIAGASLLPAYLLSTSHQDQSAY